MSTSQPPTAASVLISAPVNGSGDLLMVEIAQSLPTPKRLDEPPDVVAGSELSSSRSTDLLQISLASYGSRHPGPQPCHFPRAKLRTVIFI